MSEENTALDLVVAHMVYILEVAKEEGVSIQEAKEAEKQLAEIERVAEEARLSRGL